MNTLNCCGLVLCMRQVVRKDRNELHGNETINFKVFQCLVLY